MVSQIHCGKPGIRAPLIARFNSESDLTNTPISCGLYPSSRRARSHSALQPTLPARLASMAYFSAGSRWRTIPSTIAVFMLAAWSWAKGLCRYRRRRTVSRRPPAPPSGCVSARDPEQVARLDGGGVRALVYDQRGFRERGPHFLLALPGHSSLGDAGVAGEESLQDLVLSRYVCRKAGAPGLERAPLPCQALRRCKFARDQ